LPRPGKFSDDELHLKAQWQLAQRLTDKFWSRWIREYLPTLQVRRRCASDAGSQVKAGDLVLGAGPKCAVVRPRRLPWTPLGCGNAPVGDQTFCAKLGAKEKKLVTTRTPSVLPYSLDRRGISG
jgi:hypothetical protein